MFPNACGLKSYSFSSCCACAAECVEICMNGAGFFPRAAPEGSNFTSLRKTRGEERRGGRDGGEMGERGRD